MGIEVDPSLIAGLALQGAFVVGMTACIGKLIPASSRDAILPIVALLLGVTAMTAPLWLPEGLPDLIAKGVALGGATTGLYAIGKGATDERKVPINGQ